MAGQFKQFGRGVVERDVGVAAAGGNQRLTVIKFTTLFGLLAMEMAISENFREFAPWVYSYSIHKSK